MSDKKNDGSNNDKDLSQLERFAQDAIDALETSDASAKSKLETYLNALSKEINNLPRVEKFIINGKKELLSNIKNFIAKNNNFYKIIEYIYKNNIQLHIIIHNFFCELSRSLGLISKWDKEIDANKFFVAYVFFLSNISILVRQENWPLFLYFIKENYQCSESISYNFIVFCQEEAIIGDIREKIPGYKECIENGITVHRINPNREWIQRESLSISEKQFLKNIFPSEINESDIARADMLLYIASKILRPEERKQDVLSLKNSWIPRYFVFSEESFFSINALTMFFKILDQKFEKKYFYELMDLDNLSRYFKPEDSSSLRRRMKTLNNNI